MKINLLEVPVFYINMDKDVDKKEYIEKRLKSLGFKNVTRIKGIENKKFGRIGLSQSQLKALSQVKPPFIILEDDADPTRNFVAEVEVPDEADALYLGNSQWGLQNGHAGFYLRYKRVQGRKNLYRIYNMLASHAILYVSQPYVDMCKRTTEYCAFTSPTKPAPMPMDIPFAMIQRFFNVYTFDAPMFVQKDYQSKMSAAPKYTNKRLTEYKREPFKGFGEGSVFFDEII
jgi:hypothetical protein